MISRRKILKGGAAAAVIASVPFINIRRTFAQSVLPFDYFISPNGDDNNAGSLASPWSITALNSKMSLYAGKRVGIIGDIGGVQTPIQHGTIGGVQTTLYSLYQSSDGNNPVLKTNGGTSGASTYIASCNASGAYTPRWAIIDFSNPSGGASPTVSGFGMGQNSESATQVPNVGYITFDGLTIRNFTFSAIGLQNPGGSTLQGAVVQNCEIYNGGGVPSNNNPGAVRFWNAYGAIIHNNRIHDLSCNGGGASPLWGYNAIMCYGTAGTSIAMVITNNTTYNCSSILTKDFNNDFANCSYNYLDHGNFGSAAQVDQDIGIGVVVGHTPFTGVTSVFHHNICLGKFQAFPQSVGNPYVTGTSQIYNNTFYGTSNYANFDALYCKGGNRDCGFVQRSELDRRLGRPRHWLRRRFVGGAHHPNVSFQPRAFRRISRHPKNPASRRTDDFLRVGRRRVARLSLVQRSSRGNVHGRRRFARAGRSDRVVAVIIKQEILLLSIGGIFVIEACP